MSLLPINHPCIEKRETPLYVAFLATFHSFPRSRSEKAPFSRPRATASCSGGPLRRFLAATLTFIAAAATILETTFPVMAAPVPAIAAGATAQTSARQTTFFKVIDMNTGLPDNSVNDLTEDKFGLIWVATWNGLARFDGKTVKTYRSSDSDNSLSNNLVRAVCATPAGIWVATDNGLDFFSFDNCSFSHAYYISDNGVETRIEKRISRVFVNNGRVFLLTGDGDLMRLTKSTKGDKGPHHIFKALPKPQQRKYADFANCTHGRLLALSNEGITLLSADGERELYHNDLPRPYDQNMNIYCDTVCGRVYTGAGIGSTAETFTINLATGRLTPAEGPQVHGLMRVAADGASVYMASDGEGLYRILNDGTKTIHYLPGNSLFPCDAVYCVFVDSRRNVWCGSYRHGLFMASHELNTYTLQNIASGSLTYDIVTAIVPAGDKLYLGLDGGGIDVLDRATGARHNINASNSGLPGNNVVSLVQDGATIWAAVYSGGLAEITPSGTINTYRMNGPDQTNKLWVIADDKTGHIWAGGTSLHVFDKATHTFRLIDGTSEMGIMSLADDGAHIWVATSTNGILKVNKKTLAIEERYSDSPSKGGARLSGYHAKFLFIDSRHNLWANIDNKNFYRIDLNNPRNVTAYNSGKGLANTHVCSMSEDAKGNIWVGTDDGLYKYVRARDSFVRKNDSRLPSTYTPNASARSGGTIYFGSTAGLLSFPMNQEGPATASAPTVFTGIRILDKDGTEVPLYTRGGSTVKLEAGQNFFTVYFSVPDMSNPDQMLFECRLEGLEDVWRDVSSTHSATYTNVPSGDYRLLVRHTNSDGSWTEPAEMGINVPPHWYSSTLMTIVWVLMFTGLIAFLLSAWRKYLQNRERTRMVEIESDSQKRLNEAKLNFYASISHELRTPCFLISAQIEEILDSERQTVPVSALSGIYRNSAKLNKLINHIIDFRKNDTGNLKLQPRRTELVKYFNDLRYDYEQLCKQKSIDFELNTDQPPIEADVDPDKLEQIVSNLISNAYKYTPKGGGKITITLTDLGDRVSIAVADTGIGIMEKLQSSIFEPFFRTERGATQSSGDGIGLSFVKELVELHHGTITVDSQVNQGSTFTVILPKSQDGTAVATDPELPDRYARKLAPKSESEPVEKVQNPMATRRLLIVDDDPQVLTLMGRAFEEDYRVRVAKDGNEAREMAAANDFDLIITDIMMPDMDGHQLIRELRADKRTAKVKIVVFSAVTSEEEMLKAYEEGADAFLTKPTSLKVLRKKVDLLFDSGAETGNMDTQGAGAYNREEQKFLLECRRIIDECMLDENFGIEMLAGRLAMSHSSLYKKIRRMTGMSLIDFINEYRIYKAVSLFRAGNTNVQKVAEMCGFRDIKTFRETFKRKMNVPPKQFILQMNQ